jgi:O-acetyl-ADP-ribose deacetylase (regulator of RNase III)
LVRYGEFQDGKLIRDSVKKVAIPGMGTGVGRLPFEICALQMKKAVDDFYYEKLKFPTSWYEAQKSHQLLYQKITTDLQIDDQKE